MINEEEALRILDSMSWDDRVSEVLAESPEADNGEASKEEVKASREEDEDDVRAWADPAECAPLDISADGGAVSVSGDASVVLTTSLMERWVADISVAPVRDRSDSPTPETTTAAIRNDQQNTDEP